MSFRGRLDLLMQRIRRTVVAPTDPASDALLLERFITARDQAAFELLLWRHGPMVLSVCRRMLRCEEDAEDAFQAAFLLLARKAASIRRREAVAGWLYQTACRIALRARAANVRKPVAVPPDAEPATPASEPDIVWRDLRPVLDEEVGRLPRKYRLAIILCYLQGRTHAEAAVELGCPRGTVGVRLQRARELLRKRLTRRGLALSAAALAVLAAERAAAAAAPAALVQGTLKAALLFAAGKSVAGAASAQAVSWTQGVLKAMFLSKMKTAAVVVLALGLLGAGTGYWMSLHAAAPRPQVLAAKAPNSSSPDNAQDVVELPTQHDGVLLVVGTDDPDATGELLDPIRVPFLCLQIADQHDPKFKPPDAAESEWLYLFPVPDARFPLTFSKATAGERWKEFRQSADLKIYRRWHEGDPLDPHKLVMAYEQKAFRRLKVGDHVKKGQLLALVDMTVQVNDVCSKVNKALQAEAEYIEAGKTKDEAKRRAAESERLFQRGDGSISKDAHFADVFVAERYAEEEKVKDFARDVAAEELSASLTSLRLYELRSSDRGVVKEILKHRGEAIHNLEPVIRLEVEDGQQAAADKPKEKVASAAGSALNVPAQRDGVIVLIGSEIKEGEKVPADQVISIKTDGAEKKYRRLRPGDTVEEGQLLARLDDRLARLDVEVQEDKLDAAKAALGAARKVYEDAVLRVKDIDKLAAAAAISQTELRAIRLDLDRAESDVQVRMAAVKQAETELKAAHAVLEMYEIRSPVRGVVKAVLKGRGEAVKALETVVQIEEKKE